MKIIRAQDYNELSSVVAGAVITKINHFSDLEKECVLGLCTGSSIVGTYALLVKAYEQAQVRFTNVQAFNLDEYVGLDVDNPQSFAYFMTQHLIHKVDFGKGMWHIPFLTEQLHDNAIIEECYAYEQAIRTTGGIHLQLLGIGQNGHIGFNEPGTGFDSATHTVRLHEATRQQNAQYFGGIEYVPQEAITMGLSTICNAREIILLASGVAKAQALKAMIEGPITHLLPASILQFHPQVTVVADTDALSKLSASTLAMLAR